MSPSDTPTPPSNTPPRSREGLPPAAKQLTVKQEREQRRLEKVEAFKKKQAQTKRNRIIAITLSAVAAAAVVALIVTIVVTSGTPPRTRDSISIEGLTEWGEELGYTHVTTDVDYKTQYGIDPPAGGDHNPAWLNCGVYSEPQPSVYAVHSLEHGAVWATYDADVLSDDEVNELVAALPKTFVIVSPYEDLQAPVVLSAWGAQVELDGVNDARLTDFVEKFWLDPTLPEIGAACTGAVDGPGKIS